MILRYAICIPTKDNPNTICEVVRECLRKTDFPIFVVDDGSKVPVATLFDTKLSKEALGSNRLTILRNEKSEGKGAAIQKGFLNAITRNCTHLLTMDGDGQHLSSQVEKMIHESRLHPWSLVLGSRQFEGQSIPGVSVFGRKFSNFWVRYETGSGISDSQSGFRIYPLFHVQTLTFWTRKFDFEIEVLIRLLWKNVEVREVPVAVHYPAEKDRVSHFRKFRDNARISFLNSILVFLSLMRGHRSPRKMALAVGSGVLIGTTPFYGLHTLMVAGAAFLCRLNAAVMWVGSQISFPPLAPFLSIASIFCGSLLLGTPFFIHPTSWTLEVARELFLAWLLGSIVVGTFLGVLFGVATYIVMQRRSKRTQAKRPWSGKTRGGVFGNWFMAKVTTIVGLRAARFCLFFICPYFYLFAPSGRRASSQYWKIVAPKMRFFRRQVQIVCHFYRFGSLLLDRIYISGTRKNGMHTNPNGMEHIVRTVQAGKGLVLLSAHVGSWDVAAAHLELHGMPGDFHIFEFEAAGMSLDRVSSDKNGESIKKIPSNRIQMPILHMYQLLQEGKPIGLMGDRSLGSQFELVPFLGRLALFDPAPFRIAATAASPLIATFGFKAKERTYDFYATPPQNFTYSGKEAKELEIYRWVQWFARTLEGHLKKYPDQWLNFYSFWSSALTIEKKGSGRYHLLEELHRPTGRVPELEFGPKGNVESQFLR